MKLETLVTFRDSLQNMVNSINTEIEQLNPDLQTLNPERIFWTRTTGRNGTYERYPAFQQKPDIQNPDYRKLLEDLQNHEGKLQHCGLFYWLFDDSITIGRKPSSR